MILTQVLVLAGFTLSAASPVVRSAERRNSDTSMVVEGVEAVEERAIDSERKSTSVKPTATKAPTVKSPVKPTVTPVKQNDEPIPSGGALVTGWVDPGSQDFIEISLYHHNVHRANHSAPFVRWNNTLYEWAQKKANTCVYNENGMPGWGDVGMNIAGGTYGYPKVYPNPSGMISGLWYNSEEMNYPRYGVGNPNYTNFEDWGHFSQLVWPTSHQIGCGLQNCGGSWFGLCLYWPPGNWDGEFNTIGRPLGYAPVYPNGQTSMR